MRKGTRTVLSMQNNYQGPPESFAMVVPVPVVLQKENVKTLPNDVFDTSTRCRAPRLVEYWEQDPCQPPMPPMPAPASAAMAMAGGGGAAARRRRDLGVKVEAQFTVGEYEIVILSAKDSTRARDLAAPGEVQDPAGRGRGAGAVRPRQVEVLRREGRHQEGEARRAGRRALSPLRFHYDANELRLPIRLGLLNSGGTQDLIVNILPPDARYEVANYPNASSRRTSTSPTACATTSRRSTPRCSTRPSRRWGAGRRHRVRVADDRRAIRARRRRCRLDDLATLGLDVIEGIGVASGPRRRRRHDQAERRRARAARASRSRSTARRRRGC